MSDETKNVCENVIPDFGKVFCDIFEQVKTQTKAHNHKVRVKSNRTSDGDEENEAEHEHDE